MNRATAAILVFAVMVTSVSIASAQLPTAGSKDLVGALTSQLKVTPQQATGGAGAIFGLTKSKLAPDQFNKIAGVVPGMDKLLAAAPSSGTGALGGLDAMLPGQAKGMASLAGSFQSLGMSPGMIGKFVPVMKNFIGAKGGSGVASIFSGALN